MPSTSATSVAVFVSPRHSTGVSSLSGSVNSYMINPSAWNLVGKAAFVWAGTALLVWTTCYFHLPEMKGRSWRELDILFHRRTPARKFASTEIDVHEDH